MPGSRKFRLLSIVLDMAVMPPQHITVLGGGLTGLASAFHLSHRFPTSSITIVEKQDRLGGWIRSERAQIKDSRGAASVLLETGPRSLRPSAKSVLELVSYSICCKSSH